MALKVIGEDKSVVLGVVVVHNNNYNNVPVQHNCATVKKQNKTIVHHTKCIIIISNTLHQQSIAVGGGGAGGTVAPHSVQNVENHQKFGQMVYSFGQIVWILGHTIAKIPSQFRCRPFFFFFFFFFLENTSIWTEKPFKFQGRPFFFFFGEHLNLGRKNRLNFDRETQCIKSFFGQKFAAPPNHFELLRPCNKVTKSVQYGGE